MHTAYIRDMAWAVPERRYLRRKFHRHWSLRYCLEGIVHAILRIKTVENLSRNPITILSNHDMRH